MKSITENTELIIGIDFGSSETSAALYDIRRQDKWNLDILPGQKVIKSAVAIIEQEGKETISIGDAAILNAPFAKDFQIAFKKRPSEMNKTERDRMVAFMKGVYAEILEINPYLINREHVIYIAAGPLYPFEKEKNEYVKIAEDAGLPIAGIIRSSIAAYFYALTQPNSRFDIRENNGILIVDFGSNTIDFTYCDKLTKQIIEEGYLLGASEVEKTLLEYAMDNPSDVYMHEFVKLYGSNKESNAYYQMLYKFREAKERFYTLKLPVFSVGFDYGIITSSEKTPIHGFSGIAIPKEKINDILGLYIRRVKETVKSFKENRLKDHNVTSVFLTGGASKMDFVRQIFMEEFNEAHCLLDDNPSVIISRGLVECAFYSL